MPASRPSPTRRSQRPPGLDAPEPGPLAATAEVLRIGDLAARTGVSADALRYYERRGLLHPSGRRASGYREYPPEAAGVVHFIKHAQVLGFTLGEVEELLRLRGGAGRRGAGLEVRQVAVEKLRDIDEKLRMLAALRGALADLVTECDQTCGVDPDAADALHCPIIAALNAPDGALADTPLASTEAGR
ncbi:MerR family transcriptional regulator [Roseisolibacter agri]|uniref:HTH merR-type domain-containing protein n=1 Tax=Roseisolibacter agri TaxID=2014610 RepID=A0AA37VAB6_9BACT|nr:MerR family transcriptional regulator [Roseisolibacter agri]GLC25273.1 hypothetical protein rosag_17860 [Roseisolibacter agri]